jgi:hypothetical protein
MSEKQPHRPRMTITRHSIIIAGPAGEHLQTFARGTRSGRGDGVRGGQEAEKQAPRSAAGADGAGAPAPEGEGATPPSAPRHRRSA